MGHSPAIATHKKTVTSGVIRHEFAQYRSVQGDDIVLACVAKQMLKYVVDGFRLPTHLYDLPYGTGFHVVDVPPDDISEIVPKKDPAKNRTRMHPLHEIQKPRQELSVILGTQRMIRAEFLEALELRRDFEILGPKGRFFLTKWTGAEFCRKCIRETNQRHASVLQTCRECRPCHRAGTVNRIFEGTKRTCPLDAQGHDGTESETFEQNLGFVVRRVRLGKVLIARHEICKESKAAQGVPGFGLNDKVAAKCDPNRLPTEHNSSADHPEETDNLPALVLIDQRRHSTVDQRIIKVEITKE